MHISKSFFEYFYFDLCIVVNIFQFMEQLIPYYKSIIIVYSRVNDTLLKLITNEALKKHKVKHQNLSNVKVNIYFL